MQSLGYKELVRHIAGEYTLEDAVDEIRKETRRYAKRQLTWFRADPEFQWFKAEDTEKVLKWVLRAMEKQHDAEPPGIQP
jgi:tRNA dimethylallyltransferase